MLFLTLTQNYMALKHNPSNQPRGFEILIILTLILLLNDVRKRSSKLFPKFEQGAGRINSGIQKGL